MTSQTGSRSAATLPFVLRDLHATEAEPGRELPGCTVAPREAPEGARAQGDAEVESGDGISAAPVEGVQRPDLGRAIDAHGVVETVRHHAIAE